MTEVEVDEVFCFCEESAGQAASLSYVHTMSYETAKIPAHYAVPCCAFPLVKFALDVLSNVFLDVVFLHCFLC
jgi:hypothetical protein